MGAGAPRPAVFLDRDETLIPSRSLPPPDPVPPGWVPGDLADPARVRLLPGALEACSRLRGAGFALIVASNQGVVARGGGTIAQVAQTFARLDELLSVDGARLLDAAYFCPFHPQGTIPRYRREHPWRKPAPGMIVHAAAAQGVDLERSWVVGDSRRDIDAGIAAGIAPQRCILIGAQAADVLDAATRILGSLPRAQ
jgi:D-glycero-D-manno-heptose 1,7-bisphosphate phosphatase